MSQAPRNAAVSRRWKPGVEHFRAGLHRRRLAQCGIRNLDHPHASEPGVL